MVDYGPEIERLKNALESLQGDMSASMQEVVKAIGARINEKVSQQDEKL